MIMDCVKDDPVDRPRNMMEVLSRLDSMVHSLLGKRKNDKANNKNASGDN
jgi:hypothetical protein